MPELPEVEVLVQHLRPLLRDQVIRKIDVRRRRVLRPTSVKQFKERMTGARFMDISRRGKYLLFEMEPETAPRPQVLVGHLGMTGRMYLLPVETRWPKHAAVILQLAGRQLVFEDTRYFGRLTLDTAALARLGPEPLETSAAPESFLQALKRSRQAIKVKLLDQTTVAGVGNIYASEALFWAKIAPGVSANRLSREQAQRLWLALREVLIRAIRTGSSVTLDFEGAGARDGLFYYGSTDGGGPDGEHFQVYDRKGQPCSRCGTLIKRIVQSARSTFYCPGCQRRR